MRVWISWAGAALVFLAAVGTGRAGTLTYKTNSATNAASGEADVTLGNGTMDVVLTNLLKGGDFTGANYGTALQLSGVLITFDGFTPTSASLTSSEKATFRYFDTDPAVDSSTPQTITHWGMKPISGSTVTLTALIGGPPEQLIVGKDVTTQEVNASVVTHTPSILSSATFHLSVAGITSSTSIRSLTLQFGTSSGSGLVQGVLQATPAPEPSTLVGGLMASLAGVGVVARRRGVRRAA